MMTSIKPLSAKSKPKEIRSRIIELSRNIAKINIQSDNILDIKKAYFKQYPQYKNDVEYLESIGITWGSLIDISGWYTASKKDKKENKTCDNEKTVDNSIKLKLKKIKEKIYKVATEILSHNINNSYLSKDVFLVIHPEECDNIASLESVGVSWFQLLLLSGVGDKDFSTEDEKKHSSLHLKKISEIFGMSVKHFMFIQKLFVYVMHEHPENFKKMLESSLQIKINDDKIIRNLFNNLTEFVKYLNSID